MVRGYRELHNSWPSHNRAAQGCERADGMSFSFVSSRGDYFSFHSFVSCRDSSLCALPSFSTPSLQPAALLSPSVFLALCLSRPVARIPRNPPPYSSHGPFFRSRDPTPSHFGASRHKVIILRDVRARNCEREGDLTGPVSST